MRPLERAARLQGAVPSKVHGASTRELAADLLVSRALSSRYALPVYRRVQPPSGSAASASPLREACAGALVLAERAQCSMGAIAMRGGLAV